MTPSWIVKGYPYCLKRTAPTVKDNDFSVGYIWVNIVTAVAYILAEIVDSAATWIVREPDIILNENTISQINVIGVANIGSQALGLGGAWTGELPSNVVVSDPGPGEYRVTKIKMNADTKVVVTYDNVPIP